ncbi:beta-xylosidase [Aspergillus violaceofuscus CBS 115571]|uniref:Beta-xylosidase n=1 Tax=Aspergillus violaceofuscus (strain CBS 115571) TaxID=1450538 RepID=A0A2V5H726_ASPV1|nr:beta-xylosidase [Aspergillus violaceofuscus CBS 115571]
MRPNSVRLVVTQLLFQVATGLKNPILAGWSPDPSILRVGSNYFLATSSFEYWPSTPIYTSTDLGNWTLYAHAFTRPSQVQMYGVPTGAGTWAPTLSHINGLYYLASMTRWTYDPVARVWPRVIWSVSEDLKTWSDPIWSDCWGIDPSLFQDPVSEKVYLNLMAPNNDVDRIWGIYQCEVDLSTGRCTGQYRSLWNGTMTHDSSARPEGPKMFWRGTDDLHRATIARSSSPEGPWEPDPWEPDPNNPILFNGQYGYDNLTVQSTGHGTIFDTPDGLSYITYLARRKINGSSPLGRETFLSPVTWQDGWPVVNGGQPVLLSERIGNLSDNPDVRHPPFRDSFDEGVLDPSWYQLRTPYTQNFELKKENPGGLVLRPNVFDLSHRDTPAAILRKQRSLNMTFSARLLPTSSGLGYGEIVGVSAYLSELQHQDIGVSGCVNSTGMCIYTTLMMNSTVQYTQVPLNSSTIPSDLTLYIRAEPLAYHLGYSQGMHSPTTWLAALSSSWLAFAPEDYFVFAGASFALFATGTGKPWPPHAPDVGFAEVRETYFEEDIPDYDDWDV